MFIPSDVCQVRKVYIWYFYFPIWINWGREVKSMEDLKDSGTKAQEFDAAGQQKAFKQGVEAKSGMQPQQPSEVVVVPGGAELPRGAVPIGTLPPAEAIGRAAVSESVPTGKEFTLPRTRTAQQSGRAAVGR